MTELEQWHRQCFPDRDRLIALLNLRAIAMRLCLILEPHDGMKPLSRVKVIDQSWRLEPGPNQAKVWDRDRKAWKLVPAQHDL